MHKHLSGVFAGWMAVGLGLAGCAGEGGAASKGGRADGVAGGGGAGPAPTAVVVKHPPTERRPVNDTYHGTLVNEDYRWLEDWNDPAVKAWSEAQNAHARGVLDNLPGVEAVRARLTTLLSGASVGFDHFQAREGGVFAIKHDPKLQQAVLVVMPALGAGGSLESGKALTLVDPNVIDPSGLTTIDWFVASPRGEMVAVSLSKGGSESGDVHLYAAGEGGLAPVTQPDWSVVKKLDDVIPRAHGGTAGGGLAWDADGKGFIYTRYPRAGERPAEEMDFYVQVYHHTLGTPTERDRYEVGKGFPKIAEYVLEVDRSGRFALASVQDGDGGMFMHWLRDGQSGSGQWTQLTRWEDRVVSATFGEDGYLYVVSRKNAPRGVVMRQALAELAGGFKPVVVVPQHPRNSIQTDFFGSPGITPVGSGAKGRMFVQYQAGGPSELWSFAGDGKSAEVVSLPPVSNVAQVVPTADGLLLDVETFLAPSAWYRLPTGSTLAVPAGLAQTSPAETSGFTVTRAFATSKDGTKVPMSILHKKGVKLDGNNPTILWGYGGYGVNETPGFSPRRVLWLEQGGVFAVANLRGGGEYGDEWHRGGNLLNKQNVFDDFHACAKYLLESKWTRRERLALMGGSNGGLLMGATMTQHPGLAKAVMSSVGIYDMLRVELSPNGAFNIPEFGSVKDAAQFKALRAYSPLHNVRDGVVYPNVLFTTGANDPRVDPMQSRKMTARLQAASPGSQVLLRTSANSGHGLGSSLSQRVEEYTDVYAWLFDQLGVRYTPVR